MIQIFKKNILSIVILILGIALLIMAVAQKDSKPAFTNTAKDLIENLYDIVHVTNSQAHKMQLDTANYVFVDLRKPANFANEHIENAINIPTASLLSEESTTVFKSLLASGKTVVLYGQIEREAIGQWQLLQNTGFTNTKILLGGFDCYKNENSNCTTEIARYDYATIAKQGGIKEVEVIKEKPVAKKKKVIPVKKKVKVEEEGGC